MQMLVNRITLFKISDASAIKEASDKYAKLSQTALKDGKPYIKSSIASPIHQDPRSQDYTLLARTVFESKQDMAFYDDECAAHADIKALLKPVVGGPPLVIVTDLPAGAL